MSGLSDRLAREPDYRPHCLNCGTMRRMTYLPDRKAMHCEPVRDDTFDRAGAALGVFLGSRYGCGITFDIGTGETLP